MQLLGALAPVRLRPIGHEAQMSAVDHLDELRTRGQALPGAAEALHALSERSDVLQSVLTGNTRPSSEIKLRALDRDENASGRNPA